MGHKTAQLDDLFVLWGGVTGIKGGGSNVRDNSLYLLNTITRHWTKLDVESAPNACSDPAACICGSKFIVLSQRLRGSQNDLWSFDLYSLKQDDPKWERVEIASGSQSPPGRAGHAMVAYENNLYVFGGSNGQATYNDIWCFNLDTRVWDNLKCSGDSPPPCAFHAVTLVGDAVYMFGGMDKQEEVPGHIWSFRINGLIDCPKQSEREYPLLVPGIKQPHSNASRVTSAGATYGKQSEEDQGNYISKPPKRAGQVAGNLPFEAPEPNGIELEVRKNEVDELAVAADNLGSKTLKARSEADPGLDQETAALINGDIITGSMSAIEIIQSLAAHGCPNMCGELDISHVSEYPVSSGGFGDVYCATLRNGDRIGLKCIRMLVGSTVEGKKFLKRAAHELYVWSKCKHPNVLELCGVMLFRDRIAMVSPWLNNGHLRWFLSRDPQVDRCALCVQIVDGVDYLHGQGVVHGDLKPENVLISQDRTPKLTDFGNAVLAEYTLQFTNSSTTQSMSVRWTAPEILKQETKTTQAGDIFALGMIMLEATTGVLPYAGVSDPVVMFSIANGKLPDRPKAQMPTGIEQADRLWSVLTSCWAYNPHERPEARKVINMMNGMTHGKLHAIPVGKTVSPSQ
ncbi:unnamed protein product [Rhizoctonia solani]|uniref:Protein kinase domain-containing protein n=1 Tax=Rhizoctonia solani TaxID=456999 RepID=A0A8H3C671_9AGAM|nr:unnamed protein product [Rhizoctonia solani]